MTKLAVTRTERNLVVTASEKKDSVDFVFELEPPVSYRKSGKDGAPVESSAYQVSAADWEAQCVAHVKAVLGL